MSPKSALLQPSRYLVAWATSKKPELRSTIATLGSSRSMREQMASKRPTLLAASWECVQVESCMTNSIVSSQCSMMLSRSTAWLPPQKICAKPFPAVVRRLSISSALQAMIPQACWRHRRRIFECLERPYVRVSLPEALSDSTRQMNLRPRKLLPLGFSVSNCCRRRKAGQVQ